MTTLREAAKEYEPKLTKNIVDLKSVDLDSFEIEGREGLDKENKPYDYNVIVVDGEDYRVPNSVLNDIKQILEVKKDLKSVKVTKKGEGFNTDYTVIPIE